MRIIYYYNPIGYFNSDNTERHIRKALEDLGHDIVPVQEGFIVQPQQADLLLFHKTAISPEELQNCFRDVWAVPKVCWYFDKVDFGEKRVSWVNKVLQFTDHFFLSDGDWANEHPNPKFKILRQGIGDFEPGRPFETNVEIAMTAHIYDGRGDQVQLLKSIYGDSFNVFSKVFNQDLCNLCESVKIFVSPSYPSSDNYWSSRVYITVGSGGFMIHPRSKGLLEEYKEDKEIVCYSSDDELLDKIEFYLDHDKEREKIRKAGYKKTKQCYTYRHRVEYLLSHL